MPSMQSDRTAPQRSSAIFENFRTFPVSKAPPQIKSQLEPRLKSFRKPKPDITTALSPTGWLATASRTSVRLFRLEEIDPSKEIKKVASIECEPEYGDVRAIAISEDILAIITYSHLLLYEYKNMVKSLESLVDVRQIDQKQTWIPRSVAIQQQGLVGPGLVADIWVAIGGEGKIGVKLFKYSYKLRWSAQSDRFNLTCARNTSSMTIVGFSPVLPLLGDRVIVVGATQSNRIYCWGINEECGRHEVESNWTLNCDQGRDGVPHRGEIASAAIFVSPSRRPYLFVAINQKRGSRIIRSFTAYLDPAQRNQGTSIEGWRELPEDAIGRNALCGVVTANGQYIVAVDDKSTRLLPLQGGYQGGLTCLTQPLEWQSSLKPAASGVLAVSICTKETRGSLEIIAVDGRGCIEFTRVSIPDMPSPPSPYIRRTRPSEVSADSIKNSIIELSSTELSRHSGSTMNRSYEEDRTDIIPT